MFDDIVDVFRRELSDLTAADDVVRVTFRLLLAAACGAVLGYEREHRGKAAGLRTYMLVALGSALFVLAPHQAGATVSDVSRIIQGLAAGIGFLGLGSIVKGRDDHHISGLTTAAGIWMTSAIGMAAGMGRNGTAVLGTVLTLVILAVTPRLPVVEDVPRRGERF